VAARRGGEPADPGVADGDPSVTVLVVAFGSRSLDLGWVPETAPVVVVHHDDALDEATVHHARTTHVYPGSNLGFGQGVMFGLRAVDTRRVLLCNPDATLQRAHWDALVTDAGTGVEVRTVPMVDGEGRPTAVSGGYPGPLQVLLTALQAGRLAPRGGRLRHAAAGAMGAWGSAHRQALTNPAGRWPLAERWISGAVLLVETELLRQVAFDPRYFLYFEDVDLCRRLARAVPQAEAVVVDVPPARHLVGGSAVTPDSRWRAANARWQAAAAYAATEVGFGWRAATLVLTAGQRWHERRSHTTGIASR